MLHVDGDIWVAFLKAFFLPCCMILFFYNETLKIKELFTKLGIIKNLHVVR